MLDRNFVLRCEEVEHDLYEEDGFMKVENTSFSTNFSKTKMMYNFNNNPYNLEFVYPYGWNMGGYSLQNNVMVVQCSKDTNRMTSAVINEINIEDNQGISYDDALLLLETKIREYADSIGDIYEINNVAIEEIETEDGIEKVHSFGRTESRKERGKQYAYI